jgi:hypothetical protein
VTQVCRNSVVWPVDGAACRPAYPRTNFRQTAVLRHTGTEYVLGPAAGRVVYALVIIAVVVGVLIAVTASAFGGGLARLLGEGGWQVLWFVLASFLAVMGVWAGTDFLTQTTRFDKAAGTMTRRTLFGTQRTVLLADVVAVQAIYAERTFGGGAGGPYDVFQANLIVAVGDRKVNVVSEPNEGYVRTLAADLAAFLGVPLVDQVAETREHHGR